MNYDAMYRNRKMWEEHEQDELVRSKIPIIMDWIPRDVKTILDVGCGNGIITNALAERFDVTGTDFSAEALEFIKGKKVQASADHLPFPDQSFDLVFSSELLEHLPEDILQGALEEMKRVTKGYLFITVPNQEFLPKNFIKCPQCQAVFHVYGHLNSFKTSDLDHGIGPGFQRFMQGTFGPKERKYNRILLNVRQKYANRWFQATGNTICPNCGNKEFPARKGNLISKFCNGLNLMISGKMKYWLFVFYDRKDFA